ncbi:hypothetical protein [Hoeflea poritis]|uniref:Uncharacterized protein n=1 Tax=Hoeflea poritis TaxID=2993659 RepID=A0ABT4VMQ1_9HYPH|nr:hypothetical protein [Hoeflea poritis]MDA4845990.1 hypothetical protein [Hoeflea poritis]
MADLPILFSDAMVRALLEGRKTQTRRVITKLRRFGKVSEFGPSTTPGYTWHFRDKRAVWNDMTHFDLLGCLPYRMSDRLYVRETVAAGACAPSKPSEWAPSFWRREQGGLLNRNGLWYRADGLVPPKQITRRGPWKPNIFMPRWASRVTLIVSDVRIERIQDVGEHAAIAEGCRPFFDNDNTEMVNGIEMSPLHGPDRQFQKLWDSLNAKRGLGWDANPWVAAYTFTVHRQNIDTMKEAA